MMTVREIQQTDDNDDIKQNQIDVYDDSKQNQTALPPFCSTTPVCVWSPDSTLTYDDKDGGDDNFEDIIKKVYSLFMSITTKMGMKESSNSQISRLHKT